MAAVRHVIGIAEAKLAEMAAEMAANSACGLARIAEAKPVEMAAKMADVSANSTAGIAEAKPAKMAAEMAAVSTNRMGSSAEELNFLPQGVLLVFPLRGWLIVCPLLRI